MRPFKTNAGIVSWSFLNAILGSYISFILFARLDAREGRSSKRVFTILLSSSLLIIGCWSTQLLGSRVTLHFGDNVPIFFSLNPGFVVLSFLLPCMITFGAFLIMDLRSGSNPWRCIICALVIGLSVEFMHYALYLSLPTIFASFAIPQILISFFLCLSASLFSCLCLTILKARFLCCIRTRILLPVIFGSAITGAGFISLNGTTFVPKSNFAHQIESERNHRDSITLTLPAIISFILISSIIFLHASSAAQDIRKDTVVPRLTLASVAFSTDGRILVNEKGTLPLRIVDLQGLPKDILGEFDTEHDVFHWLMSISYHWDILMPMLGNLEYKALSERRLSRHILPSFARLLCNQISPEHAQSGLKLRLLTAIAQLADDLDINISELGYLYDRTLETGTHIDLTEFLLLSENASTEYRDVQQKALRRAAAESNSGLMLFFVRDLPRHQSSNSSSIASNDGSLESSWPQKYAEKGYRLKFMRRFRDTLVDATGAAQRDVDRILLGCRDYVSSGTKSVLEPGGAYISLYSERPSASGGKEVLVYDFAKHQTPSYRLDMEELSSDMRTWLLNASGITASELISMCKKDISRVHEEVRFSGVTQHAEYLQEKGLVAFKEALAYALEQLLQEMSFLGPDLAQSTRLTNEICVVPSLGGKPATSIIFDVELPNMTGNGDRNETGRSFSSCSSESDEAMPSLFTYSPKRLFDVSQALIRTTMEDFKERTAVELEQLLSSQGPRNTFHPDSKSRVPHSNSVALVSSFSLDTISLTQSTKSSRSRRITSKVASYWSALRDGSRSLPTRLASIRRTNAPSTNSVAAIRVLPGSRSLVDFRKSNSSPGHGMAPVPPLPSGAASAESAKLLSASSRHPYLHLSLPSPLILAKHHTERRGSDATVLSSDAEQLC